MNNLLFTYNPALTTNSMSYTRGMNTQHAPEWLNQIDKTNLVKSLLQYVDVYACTNSPYLKNQIVMPSQHKEISVLHMVFEEPFDNRNSISAVNIWGTGLTREFAKANLVRHIENMWDYEALLNHFFFSGYCHLPEHIPATKYVYRLFDPQELARNQLTRDTNTHDGSRPGLNPCGLIYTNATLMNTKTR